MEHNYWSAMGVEAESLTQEERHFMDANGYLSLGILLDAQMMRAVRQSVQELLHEEGDRAGSELFDSPHIKHPKEAGADRLADLVNKGAIFDIFYTHPKVLAAIRHVLGDAVQLSSLNYRSALPGYGLQKLHVDWKEAVASNDYKVCNSIWLLDDFTTENGATRIVPGTHLGGSVPGEVMDDPEQPHPDQALILEPAGTVVVFNSHTWHGGTVNKTDKPRRAIHSYFCRRDQPQQLEQRDYLLAETRSRIGAPAVHLLGCE